MTTFSVKAAADLTSVAKPSIRLYTTKFSRYFSTEATPAPGEPRMLTEADLKLIRYIFEQTSTGLNHAQVAEKLDAGELDDFDWEIPDQDDVIAGQVQHATALMPQDLAGIAQAMIEEYRKQAEDSVLREKEAQQRIVELERQLGEANGRLAEVKALRWRAPAWAKAIFGSRGD